MHAVTDDGVPIVFDIIKKPSTSNEAPLIFLIHGFSGNRKMMKMIGLALAERNFISVLIDLRGHGDSGGSMSDINRFDIDIQAVLDSLIFHKIGNISQLIFIGHSMGGSVAVNMSKILQPIATIGIAPAISSNSVNLTTPRNLLLIISEGDFIIDNQAVINAFYNSINNTGEPGITYFAGGSEKKLFIDDSSDHLNILYKPVIINEVVKWVTRAVSGIEESSTINSDLIGASVFSTLIAGLMIILPAAHILLENINTKKRVETDVRQLQIKCETLLYLSSGFIIASFCGAALTLLLSPVFFIISPLLFTNFITSLFLGNSISLGALALIIFRRRLDWRAFIRESKNNLGENFIQNLIIGFTVGISLIILFYTSVGFNTASTFSTASVKLIFLLLYLPAYFCVFFFYELFFRGLIKRTLGSGWLSTILSCTLQILITVSSLLVQLFIVALILQQNVSFLLLGLNLMVILISVSTVVSTIFSHVSMSWFSQIISNMLLLSTVALALSNVIYLL